MKARAKALPQLHSGEADVVAALAVQWAHGLNVRVAMHFDGALAAERACGGAAPRDDQVPARAVRFGCVRGERPARYCRRSV